MVCGRQARLARAWTAQLLGAATQRVPIYLDRRTFRIARFTLSCSSTANRIWCRESTASIGGVRGRRRQRRRGQYVVVLAARRRLALVDSVERSFGQRRQRDVHATEVVRPNRGAVKSMVAAGPPLSYFRPRRVFVRVNSLLRHNQLFEQIPGWRLLYF